jgi:mRNA-degrading endonuclease RelE of RelBE toxin-antitoxin system
MRTTLDIEKPVLAELKKLQKKTHQSLGKLASSLLGEALKQRSKLDLEQGQKPTFNWHARAMKARVDLQDKDAVYQAMEEG